METRLDPKLKKKIRRETYYSRDNDIRREKEKMGTYSI